MHYLSDDGLPWTKPEDAKAADVLFTQVKKDITQAEDTIRALFRELRIKYPHIMIHGITLNETPMILWSDLRK